MKTLTSFLSGEWKQGQGTAAQLVNPATEEVVAECSTTGLDFGAAVRFARERGGPALRALTFAQRAAVVGKLDGKLVRRMDTDPKAAALVEEITTLAHQRDMKVIALGVETEEQLALVRKRQCDEAQGYLFHRAAPAEVFTSLLQEGRCLAADSLPGDSAPVESAPSATRS